MNLLQDIEESLAGCLDALCTCQRPDGAWEDYELPVGTSDQWVTAFVGLSVAQAARLTGHRQGRLCAARAWGFLEEHRYPSGGWGYNRHTGVDADSTAHALLLAKELGTQSLRRSEDCLLSFFRQDGGVGTYHSEDAWGRSHPDVTAPAALALSDRAFAGKRARLVEFSATSFVEGMGWPTYWWRNHVYGSWYMLRLQARLGEPFPVVELGRAQFRAQSVFDLAWLIGLRFLLEPQIASLKSALECLWGYQEGDGRWPGGPNLRVTQTTCFEPWREPSGDYYVDQRGLITSSAVLMVLSLIVDQARLAVVPGKRPTEK